MMRRGLLFAVPGLVSAASLTWWLAVPAPVAADASEVERGRYLVQTAGCNDCHTPAYTQRDGQVPEQEWLIGDGVGWHGPWGTSYPTNLRKRIAGMSEAQWIAYAQNVRARPPMPWFSLNHMNREDLSAIYQFVRALGDSDNAVPPPLPPEQMPQTPYLNMNPVLPPSPVAANER